MKNHFKIILFFLFISILNASTLEKVSLRLQWKHQFEFAGFYVAKEYGYYKDAGIDVSINEYDSNINIVEEVISGKIDFGIWGSGVIQQAMNGKPILLLANYFKRSPLAIITQPDIILPSELEGKSLMIPKSDYESASYHQMFKIFKMNTSNVNLVPSTFNIQDFIDKKVDAYSSFLTNEPYILRKKGIRYNVLDPNNYGIELYDVNLFSSKSFASKNPELTKKFIEASNRGWKYALAHKEEVVDLILKKYNTQNKSKEHLLFEANETDRMMLSNIYPIGSTDIDKIKKMGNLFIEMGMTKPFYDYQSILFYKLKTKANLTKQEISYIENNREIPISVMQDFSPFSFEINGEYNGFVNDLISLLEEKTGLVFKRVTGQWVENLDRFKAKETKVIADISYIKDRERFTLFSKPYYEIPTLIFARDGFKNYKGIESFNGKKVGVQKNIFYANEVGKIKGVDLVVNESIEDMAKDLSYGKLDFAIMNLLTMNHYIKKNALLNISAIDELNLKSVNKEDLRFGINPDEPLLFSIIQKGMNEITPNEWFELTNKWIGLNSNILDSKDSKNAQAKNDFLLDDEKEYLNKKEQLTICVSPNWMPIEGINDGKHIGIGSDLKKIISEKLNKEIRFIQTKNWDQSLEKIKDKSCDILSLSKKTDERSKYLDFTKTIYNIPYVVATKKDKFFIDSFDEIKDNKFAVVKSYAITEDLEKLYPDTKIIEVKSAQEGLSLVEDGKVYGYIDATATIGYIIDTNEMYSLKIIGKLPIGYDLSYATIKGEDKLLKILEKTISSINKNEIDRIFKKWVAIQYEKVTDYSLVWKIVFMGLVLITIISYWNRKVINAKKELEKAKLEIEKNNRLLEKLAITDKLTGIYNRTKLDNILLDEINRSKRFNSNFGFCILDIDYFKAINDKHGHLVGDKILVSFANLLKNEVRKTDYIGRWGGEEFVVIVPKTNKENLIQFIEKLRILIESTKFENVGHKTASFGVTIFNPDKDDAISVIKRADKALYDAKGSGRNKVCFL